METVAVRSDTSANASRTLVMDQPDEVESQPVLRLRLKKQKGDKKVGWQEGTVDNEHMGRKKSKCCCIYKKPVAFGESSSEDDEECEHCFGHPEKRKKNRKHCEDYDGFGDEHDNDEANATCSLHRKAEQPDTNPDRQLETTSEQQLEKAPDLQPEANLDIETNPNSDNQAEPTSDPQTGPTSNSQ